MADDDDRTEIFVATAALVVSAIAFMFTLLQCLQQYFASARGYSQCNEKVIGDWATTKKRKFSYKAWGFEVEFDAPVIFVCPPNNERGPVPGTDMYILDGSNESLEKTWTTTNLNSGQDYEDRSKKERIHTADNERASWFVLLSAIQVMEKNSRGWHKAQFTPTEPPKDSDATPKPIENAPNLEDSHTLVVALQRKRKSWITMPTSITKPYATTTMCHLVEMMAVLGIYWKEFDRINDRYRAEGNGFMVLGHRNSDLGLMFSFQVNGLYRFERNRVIPVDEVKELCFGWVPTIYRFKANTRRLEVPIDLKDLSSLQMGSRPNIAETLMMIGCNNNTVKSYLEGGNRTSHLFPVSFEILGMLSQTFHIKGTHFTFIPNPTPERWDSKSVSVVKMMEAFGSHFAEVKNLPGGHKSKHVSRIEEHIEKILSHLGGDNNQTLLRFEALHEAIENANEILTGRTRPMQDKSNASSGNDGNEADKTRSGHRNLRRRFTKVLERRKTSMKTTEPNTGKQGDAKEEDPSPGLIENTKEERERRETVQNVLRIHIQEVLSVLNERENRSNESTIEATPTKGSMQDVDSADADDRQYVLMKLYCDQIRNSVVKSLTAKAANRRASHTPVSPTQFSKTESPFSPATKSAAPPLDAVPEARGPNEGQPSQEDGEGGCSTIAHPDVSYDDIWCTLVFRMLCWLMLHDFNKLDVQVPKSELLGSRMPVFVA